MTDCCVFTWSETSGLRELNDNPFFCFCLLWLFEISSISQTSGTFFLNSSGLMSQITPGLNSLCLFLFYLRGENKKKEKLSYNSSRIFAWQASTRTETFLNPFPLEVYVQRILTPSRACEVLFSNFLQAPGTRKTCGFSSFKTEN